MHYTLNCSRKIGCSYTNTPLQASSPARCCLWFSMFLDFECTSRVSQGGYGSTKSSKDRSMLVQHCRSISAIQLFGPIGKRFIWQEVPSSGRVSPYLTKDVFQDALKKLLMKGPNKKAVATYQTSGHLTIKVLEHFRIRLIEDSCQGMLYQALYVVSILITLSRSLSPHISHHLLKHQLIYGDLYLIVIWCSI